MVSGKNNGIFVFGVLSSNPEMSFLQFVASLFLLFFFLAFSFPGLVSGNAELSALMELKDSLDPGNRVLKSWTADGDPCGGSFEGVACNEDRKVANISLQGKGLSGRLSPAVAELKCLSGLFLHYNNLSGDIPREISNLTDLADLYLNVNNLSGLIPEEIGNMSNLQVLQICCNQLKGTIPEQMGFMTKLSVLALQHNEFSGEIPETLGNLKMLKRLDLSFNNFFGAIPSKLGSIPQLEVLDVRNNSLNGAVPPGLRRLNDGFNAKNNPGLCGSGFSSLRNCTAFDTQSSRGDQSEHVVPGSTNTTHNDIPESANIQHPCNKTSCLKSKRSPRVAVIAGVITVSFVSTGVLMLSFFVYRRRKQKIGSTSDSFDGQPCSDQAKDLYSRSASPLVSLEYSHRWDSFADAQHEIGFSQECLQFFRFNVEEIESATQYFSEASLLGRSTFSSVYKGVLRDGSLVAIRSINITSCKSEETAFLEGLKTLTSLRHENLVRLRGFCYSRGRSEFYAIYEFAPNGNLSQYLDVEDGSKKVLDWSRRVSIIIGIAKGIRYLHRNEASKPALVHQNISVEKILIDQKFNPMISDSGLHKLLADDIVFSALKISAAMGYLAPEYISTGRFTEKSDIYAFGVIVLQILSGVRQLTTALRSAAEAGHLEDFIDKKLKGKFSESEAAKLGRVALLCTHELPTHRLTMEAVIQELSSISSTP